MPCLRLRAPPAAMSQRMQACTHLVEEGGGVELRGALHGVQVAAVACVARGMHEEGAFLQFTSRRTPGALQGYIAHPPQTATIWLQQPSCYYATHTLRKHPTKKCNCGG